METYVYVKIQTETDGWDYTQTNVLGVFDEEHMEFDKKSHLAEANRYRSFKISELEASIKAHNIVEDRYSSQLKELKEKLKPYIEKAHEFNQIKGEGKRDPYYKQASKANKRAIRDINREINNQNYVIQGCLRDIQNRYEEIAKWKNMPDDELINIYLDKYGIEYIKVLYNNV